MSERTAAIDSSWRANNRLGRHASSDRVNMRPAIGNRRARSRSNFACPYIVSRHTSLFSRNFGRERFGRTFTAVREARTRCETPNFGRHGGRRTRRRSEPSRHQATCPTVQRFHRSHRRCVPPPSARHRSTSEPCSLVASAGQSTSRASCVEPHGPRAPTSRHSPPDASRSNCSRNALESFVPVITLLLARSGFRVRFTVTDHGFCFSLRRLNEMRQHVIWKNATASHGRVSRRLAQKATRSAKRARGGSA